MAEDKATERLNEAALAQDMDEDEKADVAYKVAIAAVKFADLSNPRLSDYIFDLDKLTSFEGRTGPYILYQTVRIQSLLRKAEYTHNPDTKFKIEEGDTPLALLIGAFPDSFETSLKQYMPHHLCDYAYRLASAFSRFYGNHHIMSESDEDLRQSRLALCALTHKQLILALSFLGIDVPERM
jgi:Arginyl-tRNA synthetase